MDDKLLEERLSNLKDSYDNMPEDTRKGEILEAIKTEQKRKLPKQWHHLPYVASFIGVGMIAGILFMQFAGDFGISPGSETENSHTSSAALANQNEIDKTFIELNEYYNQKHEEAETELGMETDEIFIAREIRSRLIEEEANVNHIREPSKEDLADLKSRLIKLMDEEFTTPAQLIKEIESNPNGQKTDQLIEGQKLLSKLDGYKRHYQYYLLSSLYLGQLSEAEKAALVEQLQSGESEVINVLVQGAEDNGYRVVSEKGQLVVQIDYKGIAEKLTDALPADFREFLHLKDVQVFTNDGTLILAWKEIGDLLVRYEELYSSTNSSIIKDWIKSDVGHSLYPLFVLGHSSNSLFKENELKSEVRAAYSYVTAEYPSFSTAAAIKVELEALKLNSYKKPLNFEEKLVLLPDYLNMPKDLQQAGMKPIEEPILPLSDQLMEVYETFRAEKSEEALIGVGPFNIMRLYYYADSIKDYSTKYALYSDAAQLPALEDYIKDQSEKPVSLADSLEGYRFATLYYTDGDRRQIKGLRLRFDNNMEGLLFGMTHENGVWKVNFLPLQ